jgi:hypothetical protein
MQLMEGRMNVLQIAALSVCALATSAYSQDLFPQIHQLPPPTPANELAITSPTELATSTPKVNLVYLVPKDKVVSQNYASSMNTAIASLSRWYSGQMPNHKTFQSSVPAVIVVPLPHDASYYANNARPAIFTQFWDNVLGDALPLTGGRFNDPQNIWAYYIDADPICNECGGCGTSGVLLVSANDLRGLAGETDKFTDPCTPANKPYPYPPNRWIGGLGHELGHAFGLPHPPGCETGDKSCDSSALMWVGYASYPNTHLRDEEKATLIKSPFFVITQMNPRIRAVKP